jgi:hypothetical protein
MAQVTKPYQVYLEIGKTRTCAAALDWPGWCRLGRDEASALQSLFDYGPRYIRALQGVQLPFTLPEDPSDLVVVERLPGNDTTDFGAPGLAPSRDADPLDPAGLHRAELLLKACWQAFDGAVQAAAGRELRKGPRGGGRDLAAIVRHVQEVDLVYLASLGGKWKPEPGDDAAQTRVRQAILAPLASATRGELPARGPRGGLRWTPRYFVRRLAWHELDHAWEIEDRVV